MPAVNADFILPARPDSRPLLSLRGSKEDEEKDCCRMKEGLGKKQIGVRTLKGQAGEWKSVAAARSVTSLSLDAWEQHRSTTVPGGGLHCARVYYDQLLTMVPDVIGGACSGECGS